MARLPTVKIKDPNKDGYYIIINESTYQENPDAYELWGDRDNDGVVDERERLVQEAKDLGLSFYKSISSVKLAEKIAEKKESMLRAEALGLDAPNDMPNAENASKD